jgi:hypothetical protein
MTRALKRLVLLGLATAFGAACNCGGGGGGSDGGSDGGNTGNPVAPMLMVGPGTGTNRVSGGGFNLTLSVGEPVGQESVAGGHKVEPGLLPQSKVQ